MDRFLRDNVKGRDINFLAHSMVSSASSQKGVTDDTLREALIVVT